LQRGETEAGNCKTVIENPRFHFL